MDFFKVLTFDDRFSNSLTVAFNVSFSAEVFPEFCPSPLQLKKRLFDT